MHLVIFNFHENYRREAFEVTMALDPSILKTLRNVNVRIQRWLIGRLVRKVGVPVEVRYTVGNFTILTKFCENYWMQNQKSYFAVA